nr:AgmX/PglI C-terminal domain-containing protein [Myxococcus sp. RHSTA-1-4]
MVAIREPSSRKALAKTASTEPARTATSTNDEADTSTSEPSSDEAGSGDGADEESIASFEGSDTESGKKVAVSSTDARPPNPYSELDEDFARELGFTEDAEKKVAADPKASRTVYIPPAPDAKQHLTPDDVKAVVVTNQPAITACLRQHAKGTPVEGGGRFMVRWSVLPSGDTSSVAMDTDALRATPLARCIEDVVRRWKFPAHQVRMQEPIRFPFVF